MLRISEEQKNPICDCPRCEQLPATDQITRIVPFVPIYELPSHVSIMGEF